MTSPVGEVVKPDNSASSQDAGPCQVEAPFGYLRLPTNEALRLCALRQSSRFSSASRHPRSVASPR